MLTGPEMMWLDRQYHRSCSLAASGQDSWG